MARLLAVITGADRLALKDETTRRTGFRAEEGLIIHEQWRATGLVVEVPLNQESQAPEMNARGPAVIER